MTDETKQKSKGEGAPLLETPETKPDVVVPPTSPRDDETPLETPEVPVAPPVEPVEGAPTVRSDIPSIATPDEIALIRAQHSV